jgi:hypothetical protein
MQHQGYIKKIQKTLRESTTIVPIYYEAFYSVLKACCWNLPTHQVTPQLIDDLANIYKHCKDMVDAQFSAPEFTTEGVVAKGELPEPLQKQLNKFLEPLLPFLPSDPVSQLIYQHFTCKSFFAVVEAYVKQAEKIRRTI